MARLIYSAIMSLDGFVADERGSFDPEAVRRMKARAERDLSVGGAGLAAHAFRAGLVDECRLFLAPVAVGGGTRALPEGVRVDLDLLEERRFGAGMVYLRYRGGNPEGVSSRRTT